MLAIWDIPLALALLTKINLLVSGGVLQRNILHGHWWPFRNIQYKYKYKYKKHIDASVKEQPQPLYLTPSIISNRQI